VSPGFRQGLPEGPPLGALDWSRAAQTMTRAGDGTALTGTPLCTFAVPCWSAGRRRGSGLGRGPVGVTAASSCGSVPWRSCLPTARRGRYRPKADGPATARFPLAHRARLSGWALSSHPIPAHGSPGRLAAPGARRSRAIAPLTSYFSWWQVLGSNQRRLSRRFTDPRRQHPEPVRLRREELGWSQRQLAERAGMSQPGVARFEAGGTTLRRSRLPPEWKPRLTEPYQRPLLSSQ
jgi:hypothetical protein